MLVSITNKETTFKSMKIDAKRDALVFKRSLHPMLLFFTEKLQLPLFSNLVYNRFFLKIRCRPTGRAIIL